MTDGKKSGDTDRDDGKRTDAGGRDGGGSGRSDSTAGTNRDYDESGESKNQGHGHPREERQGS